MIWSKIVLALRVWRFKCVMAALYLRDRSLIQAVWRDTPVLTFSRVLICLTALSSDCPQMEGGSVLALWRRVHFGSIDGCAMMNSTPGGIPQHAFAVRA